MLNCPRCASADTVKSGINNGRQRYKCKGCQYFFSVHHKSDTAALAQRRLALNLYLEGLGLRSIGRILGFSHVAVYQWVKAYRENLEQIKRPGPPRSSNSMNCIATWGIKKLLLGLDCC